MFSTKKIIPVMALLGAVVAAQPRRVNRIEAGTQIVVRTNEYIDNDRRDSGIYTGTVQRAVRGGNGRVAIPRGSQVELTVRTARDNDLILDLESVQVGGQRYALDSDAERIDSGRRDGIGDNRRTAEHVGGGAVLGTIIGAIAGGRKGAAIGAAAGAAAGAGTQMGSRFPLNRCLRSRLIARWWWLPADPTGGVS
jgi:hypothetical protein